MRPGGRVGKGGSRAGWREWRNVGRVAALALAAPCVIFAQATDDSQILFPGGPAKASAPAAASGDMFNLFTLVIALILAGVGGWFYWRNRKAAGPVRESRLLAIEETKSLGNRQYLVVAAYADKKFLLGVCQGRIDLLAKLDEDAEGGLE